MSRIAKNLTWFPLVAFLVHDCFVSFSYDPVQGFVLVDKLSKHLGIDANRNDILLYLDPTTGSDRLGRVVGLQRDWVTVSTESAITQVPKGHVAVEDETGRRSMIPECIVSGRAMHSFVHQR